MAGVRFCQSHSRRAFACGRTGTQLSPHPRNAQSEFLPFSPAICGNGNSYTCHRSAVQFRNCSPLSLRVPI